MDVDQLRSEFISASIVSERAESFRSARVRLIQADGGLPVVLRHPCHYVLHSLPYSAFSAGSFVDLSLANRDKGILELSPPADGRVKFGLEGAIFYPANLNDSCLTVFRNGGLELLGKVPLNAQPPTPIFEFNLERLIIDRLAHVLGIQQRLGVTPPLAIFTSFSGVVGHDLNISRSDNPCGNGHVIEQDPLLIPGVRTDTFLADLANILRPAFDGLWLAAGWPRSMDYNRAGEWVGWPEVQRELPQGGQ